MSKSIVILIGVIGGAVLLGVVALVVGWIATNYRTREPRPHQTRSQPGEITPEIKAEIERLLAEGSRVAAIKRAREATGWGLRQAKDYTDALEGR